VLLTTCTPLWSGASASRPGGSGVVSFVNGSKFAAAVALLLSAARGGRVGVTVVGAEVLRQLHRNRGAPCWNGGGSGTNVGGQLV